MRRRLLLLSWILATALATGLAWLGVRAVANDVAAPLPAPVAVPAGDGPTAVDAPVSEGTSTTASSSDPTPTTSADTPIRTFALTGGTATVRFSPERVEVLSAVPEPGYDADIDEDDGRTRVEFESDHHRSRLEVWWNGGVRHRVREHAGEGHDDP